MSWRGQRYPLGQRLGAYAKRFPPELRLELRAVKTAPRTATTLESLYAAERQRIEAAIPKGAHVVALDEHGTALTTMALAGRLKAWQLQGGDVALVIGGPDGLDPGFKRAAHERIRLSDLTLPHAMVRVLLVEQLYRGGRSTRTTRITVNNRAVIPGLTRHPGPRNAGSSLAPDPSACGMTEPA